MPNCHTCRWNQMANAIGNSFNIVHPVMQEKHLTKKSMTERMRMKSRMQLDRLLDPNNVSVTLLTLEKAANALGKKLEIQLV